MAANELTLDISAPSNKSLLYDVATELELIAMLIGCSDFMLDVMDICRPEDMFFDDLKIVFRYMYDLYSKNDTYIPEQILSWMKDNCKDHNVYQEVKNSVRNVITLNLEGVKARARIVKQYSMLRTAQNAVSGILCANKDTIADELDSALNSLSDITMQTDNTDPLPVSDIISDYVNSLYTKNNDSRIFSNYSNLDRIVDFQRSDFFVLAARPAVGKSAYCMNLAVKFAHAGYNVSFFTLEMSVQQAMNRIMSAVSQTPHYILKNNLMWKEENQKLYADKIGLASARIFKYKLNIDDRSGITVADIKRKCRKNKSDVIIIDYIQLLTPSNQRKNGSRVEDVSEITRQLKIMAKDLNCVVIGLSQLNRAVEARANARPMLSDLRESGSIEQDANAIGFLSKKNVSDPNSDILLEIAKNRSGECGTIVYQFDRNTQTMRETDEQYVAESNNNQSQQRYQR